MTIALYCRVSTDEQAEHGFGLEVQRDRLIAYCQSQGWKDYEVYVDDGYSGTTLDRPALNRMLRHVERGQIDCVVVYRLDRLSRRQRHCLHLLEEVFENNDVAFKSATEPFDTSTPLGKAMIGILAVFAQLERDTIIERVTGGHYKRARNGLWGGGPQPFGYSWNKEQGRLEVVPEEARIVREIFQRVINGHTLASVAAWAEARSKEQRWWDHTVVKSIIERDVYQGIINYGGQRAQGHHEPIVDMETAERARRELKARYSGKRPIGQYLLTGLLRCGECGEPMLHHKTVRQDRKSHDYYVCARKQRGRNYYKPGEPCTNRHVPMDYLDSEVIKYVHNIAVDPSSLTAAADDTSDNELEQTIASLENELDSVKRKLKRWYDAYEDEDSTFDIKEVSRRIRELESEKSRIELLIDETAEQMVKPDPAPVLDALGVIKEEWDSLDKQEKQAVLRATIRRINVYRDRSFDIEWNI